MKKSFLYLLKGAAMVAFAFVVGCSADDPNFAEPDNVIDPEEGVTSDNNEGDGLLSLAGVALSVNTDSELMVSRASSYDEAGDGYLVYIHDEDGVEMYRKSYAETKSASDPLSLPVGNYTISARSVHEIPDTAWDAPEYTSTKYDIAIGADKTTEVEDDIICTMANIKTSIEISADLKALFDVDDSEHPLQVLLELGEAELLYSADETRNGYFAEQEGYNTIDVTMSGMYNTAAEGETATYAYIEWEQSISDVYTGQARDISVQVAHYNEGILEIKFVVTTWAYDATLGVQMSQSFYTSYEAEVYDPDSEVSDPDSPVITIDGQQGLDYYIYPAAFDYVAETYSPNYKAIMTPQLGSTISTATLIFSSTNEQIITAMEEAGFETTLTVWSSDSANDDLSSWVDLSIDASGVISAEIPYATMKLLNGDDYHGTHTAKMLVTDSENRRSITNLPIYSVASDKLDIIWRDGYSFDESHYISDYYDVGGYEELPVVFDITSKTGLTKLTIDIDSPVLTPEELGSLKLAQHMDLINPATDDMESRLSELGFPVGSDIEGATELVFNITQFMPVLAALSKEGSNDTTVFTITAGDISGDCVKVLTVVRK